jgi:hypothetical protein
MVVSGIEARRVVTGEQGRSTMLSPREREVLALTIRADLAGAVW